MTRLGLTQEQTKELGRILYPRSGDLIPRIDVFIRTLQAGKGPSVRNMSSVKAKLQKYVGQTADLIKLLENDSTEARLLRERTVLKRRFSSGYLSFCERPDLSIPELGQIRAEIHKLYLVLFNMPNCIQSRGQPGLREEKQRIVRYLRCLLSESQFQLKKKQRLELVSLLFEACNYPTAQVLHFVEQEWP